MEQLEPKQRDYMEKSFQPLTQQETFEEDFEGFRGAIEGDLNNLAQILERRILSNNEGQTNKELLRKQMGACLNYAQTYNVKEAIMHGIGDMRLESEEEQQIRRELLEVISRLHKESLKNLANTLGIQKEPDELIRGSAETQGLKTEPIIGVKLGGIILPDDIAKVISSLANECSVIIGNDFRYEEKLNDTLENIADEVVEKVVNNPNQSL